MLLINQITTAPKQLHTLNLPDGTSATLALEYKPMQVAWFITQLTYRDFEVNNLMVVTSANMLRQFKNRIPFGLAVFVDGNHEPTLPTDFSSGRARMTVLTEEEVDYYEEFLSGQATA